MTVDAKYWTEAKATGGGRNGLTTLVNGQLTMTLASPKELGGSGLGHNPEELFALGYSACYLGAMRFAASSEKLGTVPDDATVNAHVGIGPRSDGGFGLKVRLVVSLPGLDRAVAEKIVERGHFICPYSNATKGNIEVVTELA
ncbi:organic hydroperoxide resistance protein [Pseudogemmobacter blasticus]|uniref:Organic hydroperoxide resistance protein n=1 Tax=Fuscovulum blasticum DSM 2131 TaxID=1188250 RepID=A0A2T4JET7_FUSBL|nr:organic hydroperoxide resistance protein [Fuscovulum blasticum]AWD22289.1 organic hydroperoxide resistance protein [Fuscovulum blasticum]PTE16318.1 organic hydroperoxide resistance protein [Fuscovulum blasticum DSM 2131]